MKKIVLITVITLIPTFLIGQSISNDENCVSCIENKVDIKKGASAMGTQNESSGINSIAAGNLNIATGDYSIALLQKAQAYGNHSMAFGLEAISEGNASIALGAYTKTLSDALFSVAIGSRVISTNKRSMVLGYGLTDNPITNDIENSLMIGFNSNKPTLYIGPSDGAETVGNIGIGTKFPSELLEVNGNLKVNNNAILSMANVTNLNISGSINMANNDIRYVGRLFGYNNKLIIQNNAFVSANLTFAENGNIGVGTETPSHTFEVDGDFSVSQISNFQNDILQSPGNYVTTSQIIAPDANGLSLTNMNEIGIFVDDGGNIIHDPNLFMATSQIKAPDAAGLSLTDQDGIGIFVGDGGSVGIGTTPTSAYALDINGPVNFTGNLYQNGLLFETTKWGENANDIYYSLGKVGINTSHPVTNLDIRGDIALGKTGEKFLLHSRPFDGDKFMIVPQNNGGNWEFDKSLTLFDNGNVGIGVTEYESASAKLTVKGDIHAREVLVTLNAGGSDFVFEEEYKLPRLDEVENYITINKHLPDIPSAKQMQEDGLDLGDMQIKLLQKIEELTLYVIDLKKENKEIKLQMSEFLKKQNLNPHRNEK